MINNRVALIIMTERPWPGQSIYPADMFAPYAMGLEWDVFFINYRYLTFAPNFYPMNRYIKKLCHMLQSLRRTYQTIICMGAYNGCEILHRASYKPEFPLINRMHYLYIHPRLKKHSRPDISVRKTLVVHSPNYDDHSTRYSPLGAIQNRLCRNIPTQDVYDMAVEGYSPYIDVAQYDSDQNNSRIHNLNIELLSEKITGKYKKFDSDTLFKHYDNPDKIDRHSKEFRSYEYPELCELALPILEKSAES